MYIILVYSPARAPLTQGHDLRMVWRQSQNACHPGDFGSGKDPSFGSRVWALDSKDTVGQSKAKPQTMRLIGEID